MNATYAGIPTVSAVQATAGPTAGTNAAPDTGGTPIEIDGSGFANQTLGVIFNDVATPFSLGTQYNFTASSNTKLTTATVAAESGGRRHAGVHRHGLLGAHLARQRRGRRAVPLPAGRSEDRLDHACLGASDRRDQVTIRGQNLGCVTSISFGSRVAADATNAEALLDCGSTDTVTVTAPLGATGTVQLTLHTVESDATGAPPATASFRYTRPPLQTLKVHKRGSGSGKITSSPRGIRCPKTCSHKYAFGKSVTLKAKPARGSSFAGWSGACHGRSKCKLKVTGPLTATAKFTLKNCVVPNVKGKTLSAAKRALKAHFCSAGKIKHASSSRVPVGRVISESPKAGTHLKHNGRVNLTVSKG